MAYHLTQKMSKSTKIKQICCRRRVKFKFLIFDKDTFCPIFYDNKFLSITAIVFLFKYAFILICLQLTVFVVQKRCNGTNIKN